MVNAASYGPNPRFAPEKMAAANLAGPARGGYPLPPRSMKTMELHRRQHADLRLVRVYRQNLEPQGLTVMWMGLHI